MSKKRNSKWLSLILCMMLIVAMAFGTSGCGNKRAIPSGEQISMISESSDVGEGQTEFVFTVVDKDGKETSFTIHTDKTIVGEALLELNLISGDTGEYGLYVKTVNGISADYEKDGVYWAFYINNEYAASGVDTTEIKAGDSYSFKVEK